MENFAHEEPHGVKSKKRFRRISFQGVMRKIHPDDKGGDYGWPPPLCAGNEDK